MTSEESFTVEENEPAERLDKFLASKFEQRYSRSYFQHLIENQLVLVNGKPVKKRVAVSAGDEIEIQFSYNREITLEPEEIPLDVLFEDESLIAVNKPKGLVVHPAPGNWTHTFANALLFHCRIRDAWSKESLESLRPGIVHRLDKDTTGVLIAAKNLQIQQKLTEAFANRSVYKEYLAICVGNPKKATVEAPIGRHPKLRQKMAIVPEGRYALSYIDTLHSESGLSLVKIIIATGRTHQVRLHLNHLHSPVLGDELYGNASANQKFKAERPYLHASTLKVRHPLTGNEIVFTAPIPDDMQKIIEKFMKGFS